jgi:hypothetical protein
VFVAFDFAADAAAWAATGMGASQTTARRIAKAPIDTRNRWRISTLLPDVSRDWTQSDVTPVSQFTTLSILWPCRRLDSGQTPEGVEILMASRFRSAAAGGIAFAVRSA